MKKILLIILLSVTLFASDFKDYTKACDWGVKESCGDLGEMYLEGNGVKQDKVKAKEFLEKVSDMTE